MVKKIFFSDKESKTIAELKAIGGINLPVFKNGTKMYKTSLDELLSASPNTVVKDNAYDSDENPANPDNITDITQLTFFRDVGRDLKQTLVISEERVYGVLIPSPSSEADIGKVPMLNNLGQIVWANVLNEEGETIEHILDLSTLDEENTTFNVVLTANRNNAISFVGSSEETAIVAIEIEDAKPYHIQIVGACTLAINGVEWWGDAITDITNKAEINIMNGRAMGVLIDV